MVVKISHFSYRLSYGQLVIINTTTTKQNILITFRPFMTHNIKPFVLSFHLCDFIKSSEVYVEMMSMAVVKVRGAEQTGVTLNNNKQQRSKPAKSK